jgi:NAD(P)-dependent dehydrogenase (short-subunit alcohol dehydrogenase family)
MARTEHHGTTALVTGAAKRIGRAIACALADSGMNVVVHYNRSGPEARDLVSRIKKKGVSSWAISGDIETDDGCTALVGDAIAACGGNLSVLVNNASIFPESTLADLTFENLARAIRVNAWAPLLLSRAFAVTAAHGRGSIVNLLDNRISGSDRGHVGYLLSKQMLASLTRMCALEFSPAIRVNGIAPGIILPPAGKTGAYLDKLKGGVPLRMHGSPADIAAAVVFCATNPFLTGEIITIDGGKHLV